MRDENNASQEKDMDTTAHESNQQQMSMAKAMKLVKIMFGEHPTAAITDDNILATLGWFCKNPNCHKRRETSLISTNDDNVIASVVSAGGAILVNFSRTNVKKAYGIEDDTDIELACLITDSLLYFSRAKQEFGATDMAFDVNLRHISYKLKYTDSENDILLTKDNSKERLCEWVPKALKSAKEAANTTGNAVIIELCSGLKLSISAATIGLDAE